MTSIQPVITRIKPSDPLYSNAFPIITGELVPVDLDALQPAVRPTELPTQRSDTSRHNFLRRIADDPYWLIVGVGVSLCLGIVATVIYGFIQTALAVARWWTANADAVLSTGQIVLVLVVALALCGGTAAKCAGLHCGGCRG